MPKVVSLPNLASSINTIEGITINGKKVSKQKYNAEMKKIEKKYPLKQIWSFDTFELTTDNITNLVKNYKSFIITGKKF